MIVVGYQGIGKSTLQKNDSNVIDLESGHFWVNDKRDENWYVVYVNIADHLSKQGFTVFLSSHKVVRQELNDRGIDFNVISPSLELKEAWLEKLKKRYDLSKRMKDYKAWQNAEQCYEDNIKDLASEKHYYPITNMGYSLTEMVSSILEEWCCR